MCPRSHVSKRWCLTLNSAPPNSPVFAISTIFSQYASCLFSRETSRRQTLWGFFSYIIPNSFKQLISSGAAFISLRTIIRNNAWLWSLQWTTLATEAEGPSTLSLSEPACHVTEQRRESVINCFPMSQIAGFGEPWEIHEISHRTDMPLNP